MSWNDVDDKHKKKDDRQFVACQEEYEIKYIIDSVIAHYPNLSRTSIEAAVKHCCKAVPAPRPRAKFWQCMALQLGISYP